jgi:hypothetical protein
VNISFNVATFILLAAFFANDITSTIDVGRFSPFARKELNSPSVVKPEA